MSIMKTFRESASLIIAAKTKLNLTNFDYRVLMLSRPDKGSFASSNVFPGGVYESADESPQWLKFLQSFGVPNEKIQELTKLKSPRPKIFNSHSDNSIPKEISLRITALREAFEEVGLLFYRNNNSFEKSSHSKIFSDFDCKFWQKKVHNDATEFLHLFQELEIIPDLWCLNEWSVWITPVFKKKRFNTIFYTIGLEDTPELLLDTQEATAFDWRSPQQFLQQGKKLEILLPPPQVYELSRLCNFDTISNLQSFAHERARKYGMLDLMPVFCECADGMLSCLPGDNMYPVDPQEVKFLNKKDSTVEELRAQAQNLHRFEFKNEYPNHVLINISLRDGQLTPQVNYFNKF